ncbi:tetratricopeptide repeat protein [Chryseobacterium carnipullorum]|uniref:Tetratricopeptide repeat protein n=1 Tax=Chryseobacterium carnipullorum TaxID=1124835 RepID=A0A1M7FNY5_CHRCU|nr:tetratricopeptide repeat protein [Chryseobacterium carnipullorum]MDN5396572.1 tetratricopeptide repeat protein [Chryseobacterium sp.]AZA49102.1 tetratricopeptide repeat protein [Chryseobacterium carnipullorum]AZA63996.1 tetratricopeptide repeat protein [Chryseobacterium carnipullorum]MDN5478738.1 tetratricopeptide repeat protein [Chryseobacterium sp.]SHM05357.1 Tetratricopeptide repeat-containing protein [Chryseobacterium carnipullorum]
MNTKIIFLSFLIAFSFSSVVFGQENYRTLVYEGNQKFNGKDYDGASSKYMEAVKTNDKDFTAHYNLGNALYKSKKYEEAKAEFDKAQKLSQTLPDKTAALHNLGNTYMQMNQPEKAADYYKQALKQNPYNEATRKNYEIAKLKEKEKEQQQKNEQKNSGKGGGGDDQNKSDDQKGDKKDQKNDQGSGQQEEGKSEKGDTPKQDQNDEGKMPKNLENAILDKVSEKEKETARKILNKNSYSVPQSNEKDW